MTLRQKVESALKRMEAQRALYSGEGDSYTQRRDLENARISYAMAYEVSKCVKLLEEALDPTQRPKELYNYILLTGSYDTAGERLYTLDRKLDKVELKALLKATWASTTKAKTGTAKNMGDLMDLIMTDAGFTHVPFQPPEGLSFCFKDVEEFSHVNVEFFETSLETV